MVLQKCRSRVIWGMKRFIVTLSAGERAALKRLLSAGTARVRMLAHARILLKADQGPNGPALHRKHPEREYVRKLDGAQEAQLVTLACSAPPAGHARWTLRLLGARLVQLEVVDTIAHETVRRTLKKTPLNRG